MKKNTPLKKIQNKKKSFNVGIVGATGLVGQIFLELLKKRNFPVNDLRLFASENSRGKKIAFKNKKYPILTLEKKCFDDLDLVFFSSGDDISKEWAPQAVASGAFAIDNSNAFRMNNKTPLVVPEVNRHLLNPHRPHIISNPNCSTIQLVVALNEIQKKLGLKEVRVCTFQAVSGAGKLALEELNGQIKKPSLKNKVFPRTIAYNCFPQIGSFNHEGFCTEEVKIMNETKKILHTPSLKISAFTVRAPIYNVHSEAAWITTQKTCSWSQMNRLLHKTEGLLFYEKTEAYPTPQDFSGVDEVAVGRVHPIPHLKNTWLMWIVGDNLLKGAALNGIQIAEELFDISR